MDKDAVRQKLHGFVMDSFLPGEPDNSLSADDPLLSTGIVPSLSLVETVTFIEETFGVSLREEDISIEKMDTVNLMVELVMIRMERES